MRKSSQALPCRLHPARHEIQWPGLRHCDGAKLRSVVNIPHCLAATEHYRSIFLDLAPGIVDAVRCRKAAIRRST
jgi:hypothetical protein